MAEQRETATGTVKGPLWLVAILTASLTVFSSKPAAARDAFIEVPSLCSAATAVDGDKVYMDTAPGGCPQGTGKTQITLTDDTVQEVSIYVDSTFWKRQYVGRVFDTDSIRAAQEKAKKLSLPENVAHSSFEQQGKAVAEETYRYYRSEGFQARVEAERRRLERQAFTLPKLPYYRDYKASGQEKGRILGQDERVYIFISQSVPMGTLRSYVSDLERTGEPSITLVMRGFVSGATLLKPTARFISDILKKEPGCDAATGKCALSRTGVNIDPLLFDRYAITKVPSVVYVPRITVGDAAMSEGDAKSAVARDFYRIYGDAALDHLFETIQRASGSRSMARLVRALKKGFYQEDQGGTDD